MSFTSEQPVMHQDVDDSAAPATDATATAAACWAHDELDSADTDILARAACLLDEQGYPQAAAVLRAARGLTRPDPAAGFGGRWQIHIGPPAHPPRLFDVTQQIKRALNSICGLNASYADLCVCVGASETDSFAR